MTPTRHPSIIILPRAQARTYRDVQPYTVISIRSPGESLLKLRIDPYRKARMNLDFWDTTPGWEAKSETPLAWMSEDQADRLARFVIEHADKKLVVHCQAGISRSAAIAAGIALAYGLDPATYLTDIHDPNPHVRELVQTAVAHHLAQTENPPKA